MFTAERLAGGDEQAGGRPWELRGAAGGAGAGASAVLPPVNLTAFGPCDFAGEGDLCVANELFFGLHIRKTGSLAKSGKTSIGKFVMK